MKNYCMPDPGEGLTEGEVVSWQVSPGDTVKINDVLCEVETAKSIVELPSPFAGTVAKLCAEPGETVAVGTPLVTIDDGSEDEPEFLVGHVTAEPGRRRRRRRGAAVSTERAREEGADTHPEQSVSESRHDAEAKPEQRLTEPAPRQDPPRMDRTAHILAKPPARRLAADLGVDLSQAVSYTHL